MNVEIPNSKQIVFFNVSIVKNNIVIFFTVRSAYPVFKQCLKRSTSNCPSTVKKLFEGMFNMFEFVCNDGREGKKIVHTKIL